MLFKCCNQQGTNPWDSTKKHHTSRQKVNQQQTNSFKTCVEPCRFGFPTAPFVLLRNTFFLVSPPKAQCMTGFDSWKYSPGMKHCSAQLELRKESLFVNTVFIGQNQSRKKTKPMWCVTTIYKHIHTHTHTPLYFTYIHILGLFNDQNRFKTLFIIRKL